MAGVERVNGASEVQSASSTGSEQRVVQQEEEQTFNYGSEDDIGDKPSFSEKAKGALHETAENVRQSEEKYPILKWINGVLPWAIKGADKLVNSDGSGAKKTVNTDDKSSLSEKAKGALHKTAENVRQSEKENPGIEWVSGLMPKIIKGLDNLVNN